MSVRDPDFHISVTNGPGGLEIVMTGAISERTTFDFGQDPTPALSIDASGVHRINSMGVANWIRFVNGLSDKGIQVTLKRISAPLVSQASMISSFIGSAHIESIMAPFFCPDCEHAMETPFGAQDQIPEEFTCPKCGSQMEFDDNMDAFLAFRGG